MIPIFPEFKHIEWSDKEDVEQFTNKFPPYSDFNFTSLYCWDTENKMLIAQLNGNLIIQFCDYQTGQPFLSFIGSNLISETTFALIDYSNKHFNEPCLKLIPEKVAQLLCTRTFVISPDRDAFDYIYSTSDFCELPKWQAKYKVAQQLRTFIKNYPEHYCCFDLKENINTHELRQIYEQWAARKGIDHTDTNEYKAFERLLDINSKSLYATIIYLKEAAIGFALFENLENGCSIVHFNKADTTIKGIYEALHWHTAQVLAKKMVKYINFEQDLGIENLRRSKERYKLHGFLQKYIIQKRIAINDN